ncbi:MAG TPA: hypothetical protein VGO57_13625 [Verrucomicrobiae bacterium]
MEIQLQIPKSIITAINQLYELEQKLKKHGDPGNLLRNVIKMKDAFAEDGLPLGNPDGTCARIGLEYEDPMGQTFKETRTDLDATISGAGAENLVVVEVVKPIIRAVQRGNAAGFVRVVQRGVVIVESQKENQ